MIHLKASVSSFCIFFFLKVPFLCLIWILSLLFAVLVFCLQQLFFFVIETAVGLLSSVESRNISTDWGGGEWSKLMILSVFIPENSNPLKVYLWTSDDLGGIKDLCEPLYGIVSRTKCMCEFNTSVQTVIIQLLPVISVFCNERLCELTTSPPLRAIRCVLNFKKTFGL